MLQHFNAKASCYGMHCRLCWQPYNCIYVSQDQNNCICQPRPKLVQHKHASVHSSFNLLRASTVQSILQVGKTPYPDHVIDNASGCTTHGAHAHEAILHLNPDDMHPSTSMHLCKAPGCSGLSHTVASCQIPVQLVLHYTHHTVKSCLDNEACKFTLKPYCASHLPSCLP